MKIVIRKPRWLRRRVEGDDLPPPPARQRLIVAAAAIALTAVIGAGMLAPQIEHMRAKQRAAQPKPCAAGQTRDCVGGTMSATLVTPAAPAAPATPAASR
jgi:hypothetical protein